MQTVSTRTDLANALTLLKSGGKTLALVPTMGALHEGHMTLVRQARAHADRVAVSIFVNPRQFGANEDLAAYPRTMAQDSALLRAAGVDLLWAPTVDAIYPDGYTTTVSVAGLDTMLCGMQRPGHFDGVATVVLKLFNQVRPDVALFGEKDWQQLTIIRRMARDLDLAFPPVDAIIGVPTVREADGLAMSSRNVYLNEEERAAAPLLHRCMSRAAQRIHDGEAMEAALSPARSKLMAAGFEIDYLEVRDAITLATVQGRYRKGLRMLIAARLGRTRLIDNIEV
jgi:pantoate--beta-alanine ligase